MLYHKSEKLAAVFCILCNEILTNVNAATLLLLLVALSSLIKLP